MAQEKGGTPASQEVLGIGIPNKLKLGSWQAGRDLGMSNNDRYIGAAAAPLVHDILHSLPDEFQYGFLYYY